MAFESSRFIPITAPDLGPVAADLMSHFEKQGYEVTGERTGPQLWHVSVRKGSVFKAVVGMKTALNVDIETTGGGTMVKVGIGIFGLQTVPQVVAVYIFWPILLAQVWGVVQQSKLDGEAVARIEASLAVHGTRSAPPPRTGAAAPARSATGAQATDGAAFCPNCGVKLTPPGKFCSACGHRAVTN